MNTEVQKGLCSIVLQSSFYGEIDSYTDGEMRMKEKRLFSNRALLLLLLPLMMEDLLNALMGTIDSIMVSNVGSVAISAVSLVNAINILVIQAFNALAAGGAIICSQYIGQKNRKKTEDSAKQLIFIITVISVTITAGCLLGRDVLLHKIFGQVEADVMEAAQTYFFYTALSFPFIGLYNAGSSIYRAQGNTRLPLVIATTANVLNVVGNYILIWKFGLGVAGAALATLGSRMFLAVVIVLCLHRKQQELPIRNYMEIRPDIIMIRMILVLGIPSGIENAMFQFGKLAIQSTVSTMGTTAIAAQAMASILEELNQVGVVGIGIGMMTVVGQCMGAGRKDEAAYYIKKLTIWAELVIAFGAVLLYVLAEPITKIAGMEAESAALCLNMVGWISLIKPLFWTLSFIPAYGLRAAGDVRFSMTVSCATMWIFRVSLCILLSRYTTLGPMAVWIGMFTDWAVRSCFFTWRYFSGRWMRHHVIEE